MKEWLSELVEKAIAHEFNCPDGVSHREIVAATIQLGIEWERERCYRIANRYEKGPEEQARIAGSIRQQIESGVR